MRTPWDAAALLHALLRGLRGRDGNPEPLTRGIESPDWDFCHGADKFFVSLFAPLYPRWHSRYSGHNSVGFVLFQPESSFRRFGVSSHHPQRKQLARGVHRRFQVRGQDYDVVANSKVPKSMRYVKPVDMQAPPIAWWLVPCSYED